MFSTSLATTYTLNFCCGKFAIESLMLNWNEFDSETYSLQKPYSVEVPSTTVYCMQQDKKFELTSSALTIKWRCK